MSNTINLTKGGKVELSKEAPGVEKFYVGCGWDVVTNGTAADLDIMVAVLNASGKVTNANDFVFYGNKSDSYGAVKLSDDNLTGAGDGDDENCQIDLSKLPAEVTEVQVLVNIYEAESRNQNFGQVRNAFIRVADASAPDVSILNYDLGEDFSMESIVSFGRFYRHNGAWKFEASGLGSRGNIKDTLVKYGVNV